MRERSAKAGRSPFLTRTLGELNEVSTPIGSVKKEG